MAEQLFFYCERGSDPGFWAEPINALSNGAFVVAGLAVFVLIARQEPLNRRGADIWLAGLLCIIGIGSFLFHTFATRWAAIADTVPIGVMMLSYLVMAERRFLGLSWWWTGAGILIFLGAMVAVRSVPCAGGLCLNGSIGYLPALIALLLVGGWLAVRRQRPGWPLLAAAALFAVSIAFRSLDRALCDATAFGGEPLGLHMMWHFLNALALFIPRARGDPVATRMTAGTPSAEAVVTASDLRLLLEDQHPDLAPLAIEPIDAGWDNFMFRLGDDLAVRMPRRSLAAPLIVHEQDWLPVVAAGLPLTAPVPLRRGEPGQGYPWRWSIVPWLPGVPADQAAPLAGEARRWAAFLHALHRPAPLEAPKNTFRGVALAEKAAAAEARLSRLRATTSAIAPQIDMAWRRGLEAIPSQERLWLHGDLHAGNVLVDRGCLSGVIDWGDITSGDPATDLASTWALFADRSAREAVLSAYGAGAEQRMRAMAWAVFFGAVLLDSGRIDNPRHAAMGQSILKRVAQDV